MVTSRQADVVVAGGGMAGLCASLAALEENASVITLEKGPRSGGSMRISGGLIWTFINKPQLREMIPDGNPILQDLVLDNLWEGLDWLEGHGVVLENTRDMMGHGRGRAATSAAQLAEVLADRVRALGGEIAMETPLDTLLYEDGAVRGVRACGPGGSIEIQAGAVVLATGGFQGNPELLVRYVTPHVEKVYLRSNPWSTGDGLIAATQIGAAVTPGMPGFYGHSLPAPPASFGPNEILEVTQRYGPVAVAINLDGHRFVDESAGTGEECLNQAMASQRDATAIYIVDGETAEAPLQYGPPARIQIERLRSRGGPAIESETLEELCTALEDWGVNGPRAMLSLNEYNNALRQGQAGQLVPPRRGNLFPLAKPPFIAVAVRSGVTFTSGGLEVDADMRVLRRSASSSTLPLTIADHSEVRFNTIPNLYAAGCDLGNISNGGYIGGLATALTTGRPAGRGAAICARSG